MCHIHHIKYEYVATETSSTSQSAPELHSNTNAWENDAQLSVICQSASEAILVSATPESWC